jgi:hypothetical protein
MRRTHLLAMMLVIFIIIGVIIGCGPRGIRYTATLNDLQCASNRSVAVAILDERPYILNKEKDPSYVGIMRGGYGNPFHTSTESGAPLADDMLTTVTDSLRARGFTVMPLKTSTPDSRKSVMAKFSASGADRLFLMDVKEWQSDYLPRAFTPERSNLFLNVEVAVFDRNQKMIGKNNLQEELTLPSGWPESTVPDVYQRIFRQLIDDSRVCRALQ